MDTFDNCDVGFLKFCVIWDLLSQRSLGFVNLQFLVTIKSITCVFEFIGEYTPAGVSAMQNLIKNS